ncbi:hypothetical protein [Methylobacterium dankookense]|uniref:hypothetical protein n=1 Tax=Methylobacterium dankookense TaxID=560405 RepID=UPI0011A9FB3B|nr:hypothetical protein [Methylobacterium dankookense]
MDEFEELLQRIRACDKDQKQDIFAEIRDSILIHELENKFHVRAEVILGAIDRASDLTQRGVRGLIAETAFVVDIIPTLQGWHDEPPVGDLSYDACLCRGNHRVRVQVKMQRRIRGLPMRREGAFCVEVQRTRNGQKDGVSTRPYRFGEFDLLAVCMAASTGNWHAFMYAPTRALQADPRVDDRSVIQTLQTVPEYPGPAEGPWTSDLSLALERLTDGGAARR